MIQSNKSDLLKSAFATFTEAGITGPNVAGADQIVPAQTEPNSSIQHNNSASTALAERRSNIVTERISSETRQTAPHARPMQSGHGADLTSPNAATSAPLSSPLQVSQTRSDFPTG